MSVGTWGGRHELCESSGCSIVWARGVGSTAATAHPASIVDQPALPRPACTPHGAAAPPPGHTSTSVARRMRVSSECVTTCDSGEPLRVTCVTSAERWLGLKPLRA
eukprot:352399-Chlamydomonas_euryale.AAC.9